MSDRQKIGIGTLWAGIAVVVIAAGIRACDYFVNSSARNMPVEHVSDQPDSPVFEEDSVMKEKERIKKKKKETTAPKRRPPSRDFLDEDIKPSL